MSVLLAGGVFVVLLALCIFYYTKRVSRRRRQRQQQSPTLSSLSPDALGITNGTLGLRCTDVNVVIEMLR